MEFKLSSVERLIQSGLGLFFLDPKLELKTSIREILFAALAVFFCEKTIGYCKYRYRSVSAEDYFCRCFNYSGVGGHLARCSGALGSHLSSYKAMVVGCPFTWNCWTAEAG